MRRSLVIVLAMSAILAGCGLFGRPASEVRVSPRASVGDVEGDMTSEILTETDASAKESGIETKGGDIAGPVSTVRYGLDEGMVTLLSTYGTQTSAILGKAIASVICAVVGLLLWALFAPAPANGLIGLIGQIVGLTTLAAGPILVWIIL